MVSTIALLNAERQKNAVLRKENERLKDALQEAYHFESKQYDAIQKAQEKIHRLIKK